MSNSTPQLPQTVVDVPLDLSVITLGAGCFWCTEAVFQRLKGVKQVQSGYSGGFVEDPEYGQVCSGRTGHAEVIQVIFDPKEISLGDLLLVFWSTHDPTTLNRQGADVGPQYRSVIFFHHPDQQLLAESLKIKLNQQGIFSAPLVTEISKFQNFYPADRTHQDYFNRNEQQPYCQVVIRPKLDSLNHKFSVLLDR